MKYIIAQHSDKKYKVVRVKIHAQGEKYIFEQIEGDPLYLPDILDRVLILEKKLEAHKDALLPIERQMEIYEVSFLAKRCNKKAASIRGNRLFAYNNKLQHRLNPRSLAVQREKSLYHFKSERYAIRLSSRNALQTKFQHNDSVLPVSTDWKIEQAHFTDNSYVH